MHVGVGSYVHEYYAYKKKLGTYTLRAHYIYVIQVRSGSRGRDGILVGRY